ncbi:MAG TPA: response regulator [Opitutaceae bacterium]
MSAAPGKTLVIVDDEKSYTDLLGQLLADCLACPIQTFNRPLTALEALPSLKVGLIVTDYCMPQINGIEFIRRVQTAAPEIPVIIITGHRMELEMTDYSDVTSLKAILAKPLSWRVLADEIVKHWPEAQVEVPAQGRTD